MECSRSTLLTGAACELRLAVGIAGADTAGQSSSKKSGNASSSNDGSSTSSCFTSQWYRSARTTDANDSSSSSATTGWSATRPRATIGGVGLMQDRLNHAMLLLTQMRIGPALPRQHVRFDEGRPQPAAPRRRADASCLTVEVRSAPRDADLSGCAQDETIRGFFPRPESVCAIHSQILISCEAVPARPRIRTTRHKAIQLL